MGIDLKKLDSVMQYSQIRSRIRFLQKPGKSIQAPISTFQYNLYDTKIFEFISWKCGKYEVYFSFKQLEE